VTPSGVVLAGGLARRLGGGDKPLRLLGGRTLLDHVMERLRPQVGAVAINANGDPARFAAWGVPVLADTVAENPGPLAGILAGMRWVKRTAPGVSDVVSVAGDTPFLPADFVARLEAARRAEGAAIACASSGGRVHPVAAIWPVRLADDLECALGNGMRRIQVFAAEHGLALAEFDAVPIDPFFNINAVEDLAAAERLL
jgi:molybdopterin-guanine dinucleotide biosynthesis protein A